MTEILHYGHVIQDPLFDGDVWGVSEVSIKYGTGTKKRHIPLHTLATSLGETK